MHPSFYLMLNNEVCGPYAAPSVKAMWEAGAASGLTLCCLEGTQEWVPLRTYAEDLGIRPAVTAKFPEHLPPSEYLPPIPAPATAPQTIIIQAPRKSGCVMLLGMIIVLLGILACFTFIGMPVGIALILVGLLAIGSR